MILPTQSASDRQPGALITGNQLVRRLRPLTAAGVVGEVDGRLRSPGIEDWLHGTWYGGPARGGEGFTFEYVNDALIAVAWFTHRPIE